MPNNSSSDKNYKVFGDKAMQMIYGHFRFMHIAIVKFLIHSPVMFISAMTGAE